MEGKDELRYELEELFPCPVYKVVDSLLDGQSRLLPTTSSSVATDIATYQHVFVLSSLISFLSLLAT